MDFYSVTDPKGWKVELAWSAYPCGHFTHEVVTCQPYVRECPPAEDRRPNWATLPTRACI